MYRSNKVALSKRATFLHTRLLIVIMLLLVTPIIITAQIRLGVEAGLINNKPSSIPSDMSNTRLDVDWSYTTSLTVDYTISANIHIESLIGITDKTYTLTRTNSYEGIYYNFHNRYLQIPFFVKFETGSKWRFLISPGIFGSYWLNGTVNGRIPDILSAQSASAPVISSYKLISFKQAYNFDNSRDNRFEWGLASAAGVSRSINEHSFLNFSARYYYSLCSFYTAPLSNLSSANRCVSFTIGFTYRIK